MLEFRWVMNWKDGTTTIGPWFNEQTNPQTIEEAVQFHNMSKKYGEAHMEVRNSHEEA